MPPQMPPTGGMPPSGGMPGGGAPTQTSYPGLDVAPAMGAPEGMPPTTMNPPGMPAYQPMAPQDGSNQGPPAGGQPEESFEERLARLKNM